MADNVTKKDIIIEAKTKGIKESANEIDKLSKKLDKLESKKKIAELNLGAVGLNSRVGKKLQSDIEKINKRIDNTKNIIDSAKKRSIFTPVQETKKKFPNIKPVQDRLSKYSRFDKESVKSTTSQISKKGQEVADSIGNVAKKINNANASSEKMKDPSSRTKYGKYSLFGSKPKTRSEWITRGAKKLETGIEGVGNTATMAVGQLTMFAGAITMVGFMAGSVFQKIIAIGDSFADVEKNFLVGAGFRNHLIKTGGMSSVKEFDSIVKRERLYSGRTTDESNAFLGRAGNAIRNYGGTANSRAIDNAMMSAHGIAGITGDEADVVMEKILDLAKSGKGKDATKLGLQELKLSKNMNENLDIIANAVKKDPIASTILKRGTVGGAVNSIKNAPKQLMGNVMNAHRGQITSMFTGLAKVFDDTANNPKVIKAWSRTLSNLEYELARIFTPEKMENFAINASKWGAIFIMGFGKIMDGIFWISENHALVLSTLKDFAKWWVVLQGIKVGKNIVTTVVGIGQIITGASGWVATLGGGTFGATVASALSILAPVGLILAGIVGAVKLYNKFGEEIKKTAKFEDKGYQLETYQMLHRFKSNDGVLDDEEIKQLKARQHRGKMISVGNIDEVSLINNVMKGTMGWNKDSKKVDEALATFGRLHGFTEKDIMPLSSSIPNDTGVLPHVNNPIQHRDNPNVDNLQIRKQPPTSTPNYMIAVYGNVNMNDGLGVSSQAWIDSLGVLPKGGL